MNAIEINSLSKYYGKNKGVEDLSLNVPEGEFFGFIGPNGAGKSTLIRTLLGFIHPTSGNAKVLGCNIRDKENVLKSVGYMPSDSSFYSNMKVKDILQLSARLRRKDCFLESEMLCHRLQLNTKKKVEELSFGNRKKLAIVCALQHNPKLLLLDEPTSGLDPLIQHEFFTILHEKNQQGVTVFLSSHVLSEIRRHCTHAAIIKNGKIIACDTIDALSHNQTKRVNIVGNIDISTLSGVKDLHTNDTSYSFLYSGDLNTLLQTLYKFDIIDITISEPDMEEIFMHYYENGGMSNDRVYA